MNDSSWTDVFGLTDNSAWSRAKLLVGVVAVLAAFIALTNNSAADVDFSPEVDLQTSTTRASSHPDARITITNPSANESIKSISLSLPDGFLGSLAAAEKCENSDPDAVDFGDCGDETQIGTVTNEALIDDSTVRISGQVFLAEPAPDNAATDPASLIVKVHPKAGAVVFKDVVLSARVTARYGSRCALSGNPTTDANCLANTPTGAIGPTGVATGAFGPLVGIDTQVADIPNTVEDDDGKYGDATFLIKKLTLDLRNNFGPGVVPLLTNPTSCAAKTLSAEFTGWNGGSDSDSIAYQATGCATTSDTGTVKFNPSMTTTFTSPAAGTNTRVDTTVTMPADTGSGNGSLNRVTVKLPPNFTANYPSFGSAADQCPSNAAYVSGVSKGAFVVDNCPASAKFGTVTITTPLLPDPVEGDVYLINKTPLPWLGIDVSPSLAHPNNPKGVFLRLVGETGLPYEYVSPVSNGCPSGHFGSSCMQQVQAVFASTPDAPVSSIELHLGAVDGRPNHDSSGTIANGAPLQIAAAADNKCQPIVDMTAAFNGWSNVNANGTTTNLRAVANRVQPIAISGCDPMSVTYANDGSDGPYGSATTDTTPTFEFSTPGALECIADAPSVYDWGSVIPFDGTDGYPGEMPEDCSAGSYDAHAAGAAPGPGTGVLSFGLHRIYMGGQGNPVDRAFAVAPVATPDDTPPSSPSITAGPAEGGVSTSATPEFSFTGDSGSTFDCAVDGGAFMPCTSPHTLPELTTGNADEPRNHTFEVRATDAAGNLQITPTARNFSVDVPFDPQISVVASTTAARQHPDLDVTITNGSHTDIKDLKLAMPDGFFGGLTGVAQVCTLAQADVVQADPDAAAANNPDAKGPTNCPALSKIGTVTTTGEIVSDDGLLPSDAVISGDVYLTDGRSADEPAGIMISVHAKIDTVDLGYINVPARLKLRAHALGIDSLALNIPESIESVDGTSHFDLREMKLHLDSNSGGTQPLLVNPSSCAPATFEAKFTSYEQPTQETSTDASPFQVTGCAGLPFAPQLGADVKDALFGTPPGPSTDGRSVSATMTATLAADPNGAGISAVSALLPKPLTINLTKLPKKCSNVEYETTGCDASTIVGSASATTPLLNEPISGNVYLLQAKDGSGNVTPRLLIALRGRINTDIIATNRFETPFSTQIRTEFELLPDAPITSFNLTVANVVSTRIEGCETPASEWNITGTMLAHNGATSAINSPLKFACNRVAYKYKSFSNRKNKSKFTLTTAAQGEIADMKSLKLQAPKGMAFNAKGIKRKLKITADGKKVSAKKCVKVSGKKKNVLTINCKRKVRTLVLAFGAGSLNVARKVNRRAYLTATPSLVSGKAAKSKLKLFTEAFERTPTTP